MNDLWTPSIVPFSAYGSWCAIAYLKGQRAPNGKEGLYLRNFHGGEKSCLRLVPLRDGREAQVAIEQKPTLLHLSDTQGGWIEFCFDGTRTLRLRGHALGLRLEAIVWTVLYSTAPGRVTLNVRPALRRYEVERLSGRLEARGFWHSGEEIAEVSAELSPGADGDWEAAMDEFWSTWLPRPRESFAAVCQRSDQSFARWLDSMPAAPTRLAAARELAAYVDWACTVEPEGQLERPTMLMSKNWMTNIWSWDNCFNAMAVVRGQPDLAWDQLFIIADHQDEFGPSPDAMNDITKHYNFCKPPVHGWTTLELIRRRPEAATRERLQEAYAALSKWTWWWLNHRRLPGQALPYYLHGNDSGWDNGTMFDQGVPLIGPDLAAFLVTQMDALAEVATRLARPAEAGNWRQLADEMLAALMQELWRGDHFAAKLALSGQLVESDCLLPYMSLLLGERLPQAAQQALVAGVRRHLTAWGLATERPDSNKYTADGYWRGPIWAPSTYIVVCGLERIGETALAREIAERFCNLCARSGFAENYDALTGNGLRDRAYTWTSSVFLLLAERL